MVQAVVSPDGTFALAGVVMRAAVGPAGIRADKQEGDGATPAGLLPLRRVYYRADRVKPPRCAVPIEPLSPEDGWCDDPADPAYNRIVRLPYAASHEELWRRDDLYDVMGVLGWNDAPVVRGRGSAIFLHIARPAYAPTAGCIALAPADLLAVLSAGLTEILVRN